MPNDLSRFEVSHSGSASLSCSQTVSIMRWGDSDLPGPWETLDSRSVDKTEVLVADRSPSTAGGLDDYVSGAAGDGEVRVRVRCTRKKQSFNLKSDLMKVAYQPTG